MLIRYTIQLCIVVILLVTFFNVEKAFAYNADYKGILWYSVVKGPPTFCVIEPSYDPIIPQSMYEQLMKETKQSVYDWQGQLKANSQNPSGWDIKYVEISKSDEPRYDFTQCDITIRFQSILVLERPLETLGVQYSTEEGKSQIIIAYQEIGTCTDSSFMKYNVCYTDRPAPLFQIGVTIRHEIGHALGLDHYEADDKQVTRHWGSFRNQAPSIMVPINWGFDEFNNITSLDVKKIIEIYGKNGWGSIPIQPEPDIADVLDFSNTQSKYLLVKRGEVVIEKISGKVTTVELSRGKDAEIIVIKPDRTHDNARVKVKENGYFEYPFRIDDSTPKGTYQIQISYSGQEIKKQEFVVTDNIPYDSTKKITSKEKSAKETKKTISKTTKKSDQITKIENIAKEGDFVTLSASSNSGNTISWKQIGGQKVRLSSTNIAEPSFKAPDVRNGKSETLTFQLTTKDKFGKPNSETIRVKILPRN